MHALTLARQCLRARIQNDSTPAPVRLAHGLVEDGRARFLPVVSSALAQDILSRGYDARTLERIYANRADGDFGLFGKIADRMVLNLPVHEGLRERLNAAAGEISAAAVMSIRAGEPEFRVLSAPCGLATELVEMGSRLKGRHPEVLRRIRCWGVDADPDGRLLPEARMRTRATGLEATFICEDLRRRLEVRAVAAQEGPFHLISCIGAPQRHSSRELAHLLRFYAGILMPGGTLLVDRWTRSESSRVAAGLGIEMPPIPTAEFRALLEGAGLTLERDHPSGEGGCVLMVARKPA